MRAVTVVDHGRPFNEVLPAIERFVVSSYMKPLSNPDEKIAR